MVSTSSARVRRTIRPMASYCPSRARPCCVEENKMSYHIEINEYQRRLIMKALTSTDVNQFSQAPGSGDAFDTEAKEFVCLVQMFGTLDLDDTAPGAEALFRVQM